MSTAKLDEKGRIVLPADLIAMDDLNLVVFRLSEKDYNRILSLD
jgi:hypothetical protein